MREPANSNFLLSGDLLTAPSQVQKGGELSGKAVGQEEVFLKRACLGARDAACPGMERWEDSELSALFSLLLETSVFQPWMYPNLLGKNTSDNK